MRTIVNQIVADNPQAEPSSFQLRRWGTTRTSNRAAFTWGQVSGHYTGDDPAEAIEVLSSVSAHMDTAVGSGGNCTAKGKADEITDEYAEPEQ